MDPNLNNIITIVLISFEFFVFPALQCSSESLRLLIFLEKPSSSEACVYSAVLQSPGWLSISISITLDIFSQSMVVVRAIYIFNHLSPWVAPCVYLCFSVSLCLCFGFSLCFCFSLSLCLCFSLSLCFSVCLCLSISFSLTFDIFSQSKVVVRAIYIFNHLSPRVAHCVCLCFGLSLCFSLSLCLCVCFSLSLSLCFSVCLCLSMSFSLTFVVGTVPMFSLILGWLGSHKSYKGRQGENCEQLHVVSCL